MIKIIFGSIYDDIVKDIFSDYIITCDAETGSHDPNTIRYRYTINGAHVLVLVNCFRVVDPFLRVSYNIGYPDHVVTDDFMIANHDSVKEVLRQRLEEVRDEILVAESIPLV